MAVTPFNFPPLFRKPKNVEIPKRLGVRAVVVDSSNNFLLTLQDILNPELSLRRYIFQSSYLHEIFPVYTKNAFLSR